MANPQYPFPFFSVQFKVDGSLFQQSDIDQLLVGMARDPKPSDLFVFSHGWNNNMNDAKDLYSRLSVQIAAQVSASPSLLDRTFALCGVLWPSKRFEDKDLIPGGAASLNDAVTDEKAQQRVTDLHDLMVARGWPTEQSNAELDSTFSGLLAALNDWEDDPAARRQVVETVRGLLPKDTADAEDASNLFFRLTPDALIENLKRTLNPPPITPGSSAASLDPFASSSGEGIGGAASFRDVVGGIKGALLHFLNYTTYYVMKARAGDVGVKGVALLLGKIREARPDIRLHLIGHSFGCRVVAAAVHALPLDVKFRPNTMALLQGAFSHNGFASNFDGNNNDGAFRQVVAQKKVKGPIIITHTRNDKAVSIAYPIASRIAGQVAAALGDENDMYGGLGSNGAQTAETTRERVVGTLLSAGSTYPFSGDGSCGHLYNLKADQFISGHSDIVSPAVCYAITTAITCPDAA
jgi:hypothetical protein